MRILAESYTELSETQRTVLGLGATFGAIFVAWQVPATQRFMRRWFLADPLKNRPITMLTSIFSHKVRPRARPACRRPHLLQLLTPCSPLAGPPAPSPAPPRPPRSAAQTVLHLSFNTIAFYSIATSTASFLSFSPDNTLPRATSRYEFLALFVTAGLASSLASHVWSCKVLIPRLLRVGLGKQAVRDTILPSLGASGECRLSTWRASSAIGRRR